MTYNNRRSIIMQARHIKMLISHQISIICTNKSRCVNVQFPIIDFKLIYTNYNQHSFNSGNENDECFSLAAATTTGHLTLKTSMCACWDWTWTWKICVSVVGAISMYACVNLWLLMYSAGGLGIIWAIPVILYFYILYCCRYKFIVFLSVHRIRISSFVHLVNVSRDT